MLDVPQVIFKNRMLRPVRDPSLAKMENVNLAAGTYAAGTVLGQLSAGATNDQQTVTITGTPTGGTFKLTLSFPASNPQTTAAIAYNASAATVQAALAALPNVGSGNVTCTGGALPGSAVVATFGGLLSARPVPLMTATNSLTGGTTPAVTPSHTTTGSTGGQFAAYGDGNSDGTQTAVCICAIDCVVDASGYASFSTGTGGLWGEQSLTVPTYYSGDFNSSDLVGLDSGAVADLEGRFAIGSLSGGGVFHFG